MKLWLYHHKNKRKSYIDRQKCHQKYFPPIPPGLIKKPGNHTDEYSVLENNWKTPISHRNAQETIINKESSQCETE